MKKGDLIRLVQFRLPRALLISGKSMEVPTGWATDSLLAFLDTAQRNSFALFERRGAGYPRLAAIDKTFETFLTTAPSGFEAFFLPRAHAAWRAAVRIGISGQVPETFLLLRGAIEWAMYAAYLKSDDVLVRHSCLVGVKPCIG